jgi:hypothetical protein
VNVIYVAQNIKQSVSLVNYFLIIPLHSYKVKKLGYIFFKYFTACLMLSFFFPL